MARRRVYTHILFDLDHTLTFYSLSTVGVIAESLRRLKLDPSLFGSAEAAAARYDALWVAFQHDARTAGELRRRIWHAIATENGAPAAPWADRIAEEYATVRGSHGPQLVSGVPELLADLRSSGYGLGLLTNGEGYLQWETIRTLGVEPWFDEIVVAGDIEIYKPDPRAFDALLRRLDARPDASLFVGDSYEMDVVGAHGAGIASAWIRPDGTSRPGLVAPTYEFTSVLGVREVTL